MPTQKMLHTSADTDVADVPNITVAQGPVTAFNVGKGAQQGQNTAS